MKSRLTLAVAFLLAAMGSASAKNISFDGYCDGMNIKVTEIYAVGPFTGCESSYISEGFKAKIDGVTYVILSVNSFGSSYAVTYLLQYPFVAGGAFYVFDTADGVSQGNPYTGTYSLGKPSAEAAKLPSTQHAK